MNIWAGATAGFCIGGVISLIWNYLARRSQAGAYVCFTLAGLCGLMAIFSD